MAIGITISAKVARAKKRLQKRFWIMRHNY